MQAVLEKDLPDARQARRTQDDEQLFKRDEVFVFQVRPAINQIMAGFFEACSVYWRKRCGRACTKDVDPQGEVGAYRPQMMGRAEFRARPALESLHTRRRGHAPYGPPTCARPVLPSLYG